MGKFINPFTDYGFKKIFGQEVSKEPELDSNPIIFIKFGKKTA